MPRPILTVWTLFACASWCITCALMIKMIFQAEERPHAAEYKETGLHPRFEEVSRSIWTATPMGGANLLRARLQLWTPWISVRLTENQQPVETWGPCSAEWDSPQGDRWLWTSRECQLWPLQNRLEAWQGVCQKLQHCPPDWKKVWEVQGEQWEVDLANVHPLLSPQ